MNLNHGINTYKGIKEACPGAEIGQKQGCYLRRQPQEPKIFLVAIAGGVIQDERITFLTKKGEIINLKCNCRNNLTLSLEPFFLQLKPFEGDEVNEVAVIKFDTFPFGPSEIYPAVCEGLILRKFWISCWFSVYHYEQSVLQWLSFHNNNHLFRQFYILTSWKQQCR